MSGQYIEQKNLTPEDRDLYDMVAETFAKGIAFGLDRGTGLGPRWESMMPGARQSVMLLVLNGWTISPPPDFPYVMEGDAALPTAHRAAGPGGEETGDCLPFVVGEG